ncbi:MAG TPA: FG-GAP-like repeat-containing protein, partial [Urbifossiella sp.]|nr:FG-GAP-like repeat-containing protein [Urbifossiella sp.]
DGSIVVAGSVQTGATDFDFGVIRLTAAGALDPTFSGDGKETIPFNLGGADEDRATSVAVAPAGQIVVAGFAETAAGSHDFAAVRLLPADGSLDPAFGTGGKATVDFGGDDRANAVTVRPDGGIVLAGYSNPGTPTAAVAELAANGVKDTTFGGGDGTFTFSFSAAGVDDRATGVTLDDRGRLVLAGRTVATTGAAGDFGVARVLAGGSGLDTSFGTGGKATVEFGGDDGAAGLTLDPDGRIIVAGTTSQDQNIAVARLIGGVEKGDVLAVGGSTDGKATVFEPSATGSVPNTGVAILAAFGTSTAVIRTAVGDVNGDGVPDSILVTGPGVPIRVAVVSGLDNSTLLLAPFDPFGGDFTGGGFVSAGDFDGDGRAEIVVTPDQGGGPRVVVYGRSVDGDAVVRATFLGIDDSAFRGGARTAVGDVNGDGVPDLVVAAGFGGGPRVAVFDGKTILTTPTRLVSDFFAFPGTDAADLRNGAFVAAGDVNGDGFADLVFGGGPGGGPRVFILSGQLIAAGNVDGAYAAPVANFFVAGKTADRGGVRVAVADLDGDNKADVVAGSGEGSPGGMRVYLGKDVTGAAEPTTFQDVQLYGGVAIPGGAYVG